MNPPSTGTKTMSIEQAQKPGTLAGVSETGLEMAAEMIDPALWATLQLTKPGQPQPTNVGEVVERIRAIMATAIDMAIQQRERKAALSALGDKGGVSNDQ